MYLVYNHFLKQNFDLCSAMFYFHTIKLPTLVSYQILKVSIINDKWKHYQNYIFK